MFFIYRRFIMKQKQTKYLDLKDKVFFKRYFSSNRQVLFSLIKSFLLISGDASDISMVDSDVLDIPDGSQVVPDLRVQLSSGENIGIEMQPHFEEHFLTKMTFYWAQLHLQQLKREQNYAGVKPSYLLAFTVFDLFDEESHINEVTMALCQHQGKQVSKNFNMMIVSLKNF